MTDLETVREVIELFTVNHFETIEMSGTIKQEKKGNINYLNFNLCEIKWDGNLDSLHRKLTIYLQNWAKIHSQNFQDYTSISTLIIEYILPEKGGINRNESRVIKLFHLPYYLNNRGLKKNSVPSIKFLKLWHNIFIRNTFITLSLTIPLILLSIYKLRTDNLFHERLSQSYEYINVASGIIASFVLGFLINKVVTIRQDKLKHTRAIRKLSNKLTYFRNICYNLPRDHTFWAKEKPFYNSFEHGRLIRNEITFDEYHFPNYSDKIEYAKYQSYYQKDVIHGIVTLVLQLHMLADETFLDSGLNYTKYPPNHIYTHDEMEKFISFNTTNQIWYCCSEIDIFPETFTKTYQINEIIEDINRIYPKNKIQQLTKKKLEKTSLDFQYNIIPRLYYLTQRVSLRLPLTFQYFIWTFTLLLTFGLLVPILTYIFISTTYAFLNIFVVIGIIGHILLTLKPILEAENSLNIKKDYL